VQVQIAAPVTPDASALNRKARLHRLVSTFDLPFFSISQGVAMIGIAGETRAEIFSPMRYIS
jgi:hypothetical protein